MKISKRQLRRIILEFWDKDVEQFLIDNATEYRLDPNLDARSIKMLLMDDFMDHIGHSEDPADYEELINQLAAGEIRESSEKSVTLSEIRFQPQTPSELGVTLDGVIENFYNGKADFESTIEELRFYLASSAKKEGMDVDSLIDRLVDKKFSFELDGFLYDPKFRDMLK